MKEEIFTGGKRQEGIMVLWQDQQQMKSRFFEYGELIDQKINALDLLDHPKMYRLDPESPPKKRWAAEWVRGSAIPLSFPSGLQHFPWHGITGFRPQIAVPPPHPAL